jgi:hypothetical protein
LFCFAVQAWLLQVMAMLVLATMVETDLVTALVMVEMDQAMVAEMERPRGPVIALALKWIFLSCLHTVEMDLVTAPVTVEMDQATVAEMGRPMGPVIALARNHTDYSIRAF